MTARIFSVDTLAVWNDGCGVDWMPIFQSIILREALDFYEDHIKRGYVVEKDGHKTKIWDDPDEGEMQYKLRLSYNDIELMKSSYRSVSVNGPDETR